MRQELSSITWPQNSNSFALNESQGHGAEFVGVNALPVIVTFDPTVTFRHAHLREEEKEEQKLGKKIEKGTEYERERISTEGEAR